MPDNENLIPTKGDDKEEPKKPPRRKVKKSTDEAAEKQIDKDASPEAKTALEPEIPRSSVKALVPVGPSVDEKLIEEAVAVINEKLNKGVYRTYLEIGQYLLERFFNGDIKLASSRNPRKLISFNALCQHAGLGIDSARLSVMVRVAAQEEFFQEHDLITQDLSYTQKAELVKLPNDAVKLRLLEKLQKGAFTTKQTAQLVAEKKGVKRRKRPTNSTEPHEPASPPVHDKLLIELIVEHLQPLRNNQALMIGLARPTELAQQLRALNEAEQNAWLAQFRDTEKLINEWFMVFGLVGKAIRQIFGT